MKKISIKVTKPFAYDGVKRKVGEVLTIPLKHAEALILVSKAERFTVLPKKRGYRTRQAKPTQKIAMKATNQANT